MTYTFFKKYFAPVDGIDVFDYIEQKYPKVLYVFIITNFRSYPNPRRKKILVKYYMFYNCNISHILCTFMFEIITTKHIKNMYSTK